MTETTSREDSAVTSPEGRVLFAALKNPRKSNKTTKSGEAIMERTVRLYIDGDTPGAAEFRAHLKSTNPKLVITENSETGESLIAKEGDYLFNASSAGDVAIFDESLNEMETDSIPMLDKESRAIVTVATFNADQPANKRGINLLGVQLTKIVEYVGKGSESVDREKLKAKLKAARGQ